MTLEVIMSDVLRLQAGAGPATPQTAAEKTQEAWAAGNAALNSMASKESLANHARSVAGLVTTGSGHTVTAEQLASMPPSLSGPLVAGAFANTGGTSLGQQVTPAPRAIDPLCERRLVDATKQLIAPHATLDDLPVAQVGSGIERARSGPLSDARTRCKHLAHVAFGIMQAKALAGGPLANPHAHLSRCAQPLADDGFEGREDVAGVLRRAENGELHDDPADDPGMPTAVARLPGIGDDGTVVCAAPSHPVPVHRSVALCASLCCPLLPGLSICATGPPTRRAQQLKGHMLGCRTCRSPPPTSRRRWRVAMRPRLWRGRQRRRRRRRHRQR